MMRYSVSSGLFGLLGEEIGTFNTEAQAIRAAKAEAQKGFDAAIYEIGPCCKRTCITMLAGKKRAIA